MAHGRLRWVSRLCIANDLSQMVNAIWLCVLPGDRGPIDEGLRLAT